jgi:hypothetical protein
MQRVIKRPAGGCLHYRAAGFFCSDCGRVLTWKCKCGASLPGPDRFCRHCGKRRPPPTTKGR